MILDERSEFCDATSVAAAAGTALVGDVIDLQATGIDLGEVDLWLIIQCTTAIITGGTAGTVQFALASDAQAAIATDGSATVHYLTGEFVTDDAALNDLNIGDEIAAVKLPAGDYERYLGILVITGTTTSTAGAINAFLTPNRAKVKHYADASQ